MPLFLDKQKLSVKVLKKLGLKVKKCELGRWKEFVNDFETAKKEVTIAVVGKYFATGDYTLSDSYLCVIEAVKHAAAKLKVKPVFKWISSEEVEKLGVKKAIGEAAGIIVPQGWGSRGVEGKIATIKYAREKKIPYLGLCFGMQMAVIEYARNVCGLAGANSEEVDSKARYKVIHIMPEQEKYLKAHQYGGTIRLGAWPCRITRGTLLEEMYRETEIKERHRHRYEVNNEFREVLEKKGLVISGVSPDGKLVEAIELPQKKHPFFVATQFHPEYQSRPLSPHPIFVGFLEAAEKSM